MASPPPVRSGAPHEELRAYADGELVATMDGIDRRVDPDFGPWN